MGDVAQPLIKQEQAHARAVRAKRIIPSGLAKYVDRASQSQAGGDNGVGLFGVEFEASGARDEDKAAPGRTFFEAVKDVAHGLIRHVKAFQNARAAPKSGPASRRRNEREGTKEQPRLALAVQAAA